MEGRILVWLLPLFWIASVKCNSIGFNSATQHGDGDDTVYNALLVRIEKLEKAVGGHPDELEALRSEFKNEIAGLRQSHAAEITDLKEQFDAQLKDIKNENELYRALLTSVGMDEEKEQQGEESGSEDSDGDADIEIAENHGIKLSDDIDKPQTKGKIGLTSRDGVTGMAGPFSSLMQKQRIRRAEGDMTVAFFATLGPRLSNLGHNQNVKFDTVITNIGSAYDEHVGVFKAPVSGVYVFSTTMVAYQSTQTHFGLFRNSQQLTILWVNGADNPYDGSSNTIVLHLNQNDDVTVQHTESDKAVNGDRHCMFSGFLLAQDDQSVIVGK